MPNSEHKRRRAAPRRARLSRVSDARQGRDRRHQAARQPARPLARLLARRRRGLRGDRRRPGERLPLHRARQPGGRDHQRHRGARPGRHRPAGRQAGDGRQGRACSRSSPASTSSTSSSTRTTPTSWSTSSPRSSRPSAASTSRTSRRRSASTSSAKLRERMKIPVFHDDQHGTAIIVGAALLNGLQGGRQGHRRGQARRLGRRRRGARLPGPAGQARRASARTSGSPTSPAWSTRAAPS